MNADDEYTLVESPLVQTLETLGWATLDGDPEVPEFTERSTFREVILAKRLAAALRRINLDNSGQEWLDDTRIQSAINSLLRLPGSRLTEFNEQTSRLLLEGVSVDGLDGERGRTVRFIDFDYPERNEFLVVRQFRVDGREIIIPDVVLFVNGIPLAVIECKSPSINDPMAAGIEQLLRYTNQRDWIDDEEGAEALFATNQLLISTCGDRAEVGTIGAAPEHFAEWKDVAPLTPEQVKGELGVVGELSGQQTLAAGLLRPVHLLDVVRHFILFKRDGSKTVKLLARYPQFRAVHKVVERLRIGQTREQDGDHDTRGGIVWHTQGSGKSFTMTFLVRSLRSLPDLRRFKVVVVTDRTDLQEQLSASAVLSGEEPRKATSATKLQEILSETGPDLVFAMIQKYRGPEEVEDEPEAEPFPVANESTEILVLVDEAHRSHASTLHANLRRAMPNCAMVGFTGTPILDEDKKKTEEIFGPFLDTYTLKQSEADGATLPIRYEGWEAKGVIVDGHSIDGLFDEYFKDRTPEDRKAIQGKYANRFKLLEAQQLIATKAAHMLRHYIDNVLPRGLKAQVVAVSRKAAVRYRDALASELSELIQKLEKLPPNLLGLSPEVQAELTPEEQFLARAHVHLDTLRRIEIAAVISGEQNDSAGWKEWSDPAKTEQRVGEKGWFKMPLVADDLDKQHGLAILCVKSMLLTGFDAPVEQALYLDRPMRGAELLQAIARVNRIYPGKGCGLVVDYCGVAKNLSEALAVYSQTDREGVMRRLLDDLPTLEDRHRDVMGVFRDQGLDIYKQRAECVDLLADIKTRAEFTVKLRLFLEALDMLLPRPEGLPFTRDARQLGLINMQASNRYRDGQLNVRGAGPRVEALIDQYVRAKGIDPKVPPISILDVNFPKVVQGAGSSRAKASEMEHAARYHISVHMAEDPAHYKRLSERLEEILKEFHDDWDALAGSLWQFTEDLRKVENREVPGLDTLREAPFYRVLAEEIGAEIPAERQQAIKTACRELTGELKKHLCRVDFWRNKPAQDQLRGWVVNYLDSKDLAPFEKLQAIADRVLQLARALHTRLAA
ncbi:MAG: type I restriction endonuclease subunit R [Planctomycetia bacterium]|nr:type I restriction endonuclease subunit R [Planctomycetia bacterium]